MKENSIEEDIKILEEIIKGDEDCINAIYSQMKVKNDNDEDIQYYKKEIQSIKNIVDNYLKEKARADKLEKEYSAMLTESDENECDYKRVLKENEELKQEKIDNQKINLLAQNSMLDYQNGYEDGKANRRSAVQSIIDNQQYYIFQKQIEKYEKEIEKLQKENEELKNLMAHKNDYTKKLEEDLFENCSNYVIPVQKVKDKIEEEKIPLTIVGGRKNKKTLEYGIKLGRRHVLQELLEGRE